MTKEKELPLHEIFLGIYSFFVRFFLMIAVFTAIGFAVGVYFHLNSKKVYKGSAIAYSPVLSNQRLVSLVSDLEKIRKSNELDLLASTLGINSDEAATIKRIEAETIKDFDHLFDKDLNPRYESNCIKIEVLGYNHQLYPTLNEKIEEYLSNNDYLQERTSLRRIGIQKTIEKFEEEIREIDSLQILKLSRLKNGKINDYFELSLSNAETQSLLLKRQLETSKEDLVFTQPIVFIKKLQAVPYSDAIIYKPLAVFGFIFFLLGVFVSLVIHFNRLLRKR